MPSGRLITTLSLADCIHTHSRETNEGACLLSGLCGLKHFFLFCTLSFDRCLFAFLFVCYFSFYLFRTDPHVYLLLLFPGNSICFAREIYTRAGGGRRSAAAARLRAASLLSLSIWMTTSRRGDRCVWLGCLLAWAGYSRSRLLPASPTAKHTHTKNSKWRRKSEK
jgi:hypothetical protein